MGILLIILGIIGWVVSVNGWFIVPVILYKGLIIGGIAWLLICLLFNIIIHRKATKTFNKHFNDFGNW